jgi:hypothetical protein
MASGDERLDRAGPAFLELAEVADRVGEGLWAGVDRADDGLVLQSDVPHDVVGRDGDGAAFGRYAREDVDAVHAEHAHDLEGDVTLAHGLIDEVDVADAFAELIHADLLRGDVFRVDGGGDVGLEIGLGRTRVDEDAEALDEELHRAQQADGARAEDDGVAAVAAPAPVAVVVFPGQALLHFQRLGQALLGDGERLGHDGHVAQVLRHGGEVGLLLDEDLGHEAVALVDAAFGEGPGEAEVLAAFAARGAAGIKARPAHAGDDEVARLEAGDAGAHLDDLTEAFMAEQEVVVALRRLAVGEGADLAVGAADPDLEGADLEFVGGGDRGLGEVDQSHLAAGGDDAHTLHHACFHLQWTERVWLTAAFRSAETCSMKRPSQACRMGKAGSGRRLRGTADRETIRTGSRASEP